MTTTIRGTPIEHDDAITITMKGPHVAIRMASPDAKLRGMDIIGHSHWPNGRLAENVMKCVRYFETQLNSLRDAK